jgi:hypothetical protein
VARPKKPAPWPRWYGPIEIFTHSRTVKDDLARYLIREAGSVDAAHRAVTKAGPQPQRDYDWDRDCLLVAYAIQKKRHRQRRQCTDRKAMREAIRLMMRDDVDQQANTLRRLQWRIKGQTLAIFAKDQPYYLEVSRGSGTEGAFTTKLVLKKRPRRSGF